MLPIEQQEQLNVDSYVDSLAIQISLYMYFIKFACVLLIDQVPICMDVLIALLKVHVQILAVCQASYNRGWALT